MANFRILNIFKSKKNKFLAGAIIFCLLLIIGAVYFFISAKNFSNEYKAVFLSNGHVYFGIIAGQDKNNIELKDIYYLQMKEPLQGQDIDAKSVPPDLTLIKLGSELHGPSDYMLINRDHVIFIETLKNDSKVVRAIMKHKKTGAGI